MTEDAQRTVRYEQPLPGVARLVLARPHVRNAQDKRLLYELNEGFDRAAQDDEIKVVILAGDGPHFSAGHDLRDFEVVGARQGPRLGDFAPVSQWGGFDLPGVEGWMAMEEEVFLGLCWRWRNFPKPTIAQVQGKAIAGGLMLVWVCDLIVAASNAEFSDPVVAFGMNGHEYFVHPWELGARRAKEMLFTSRSVTAEEARQLGMVNQVVAPDQLAEQTLALAERIARQPSIGLKLAKQAVNQSLDAQGQWTALQGAFSIHQAGHAHHRLVHGHLVDPAGVDIVRALSSGAARVPQSAGSDAAAAAAAAGIPEYLADVNLYRVLLRDPPLAKAVADLVIFLWRRSQVGDRLRELIIMRVAWLTGCAYEWSHHWDMAQRVGVPAADLLAVREWEGEDGFSAVERAALAAVDELIAHGAVSDRTRAMLAAELGDERTLLEVLAVIATWRMVSELLRSLDIALEEGFTPWPPDGRRPEAGRTAGLQ